MAKFSIMLFGFDSYTKAGCGCRISWKRKRPMRQSAKRVRGQGEPTRNL